VFKGLKQGVGQFTVKSINLFFFYLEYKEELPEEWKESVILPMYKKGDKKDFSNYTGISLLSTTHRILCNILL